MFGNPVAYSSCVAERTESFDGDRKRGKKRLGHGGSETAPPMAKKGISGSLKAQMLLQRDEAARSCETFCRNFKEEEL
jgi:hypothetical protein